MKNITVIKFDLYNLIAIAGLCVVGFALWSVRGFLLTLVVALVLSTFIEDFVVRGEKYKIPRFVSVLLFYVVMFLVFSAVVVFMVPVIINEVGTLSQYYPEITNFIHVNGFTGSFDQVNSLGDVIARLRELSFEKVLSNVGSFFGGIFNVILVFVVSFYLSMQDHSVDRLLKVFVPKHYENSVLRVWHNTQKKIGGWFRGQLIIAALLIVVTYIGLSLMGVPYALLLSLLAGVFGLVPYGIFLAVIPAIALAFIKLGWQMGVAVVVFYFLVQQILDLGIQPLLFKRMTGIPSLLVVLSMIAGAQLFGIAGLIIAIPFALFGLEIINEIEYRKNHHE